MREKKSNWRTSRRFSPASSANARWVDSSNACHFNFAFIPTPLAPPPRTSQRLHRSLPSWRVELLFGLDKSHLKRNETKWNSINTLAKINLLYSPRFPALSRHYLSPSQHGTTPVSSQQDIQTLVIAATSLRAAKMKNTENASNILADCQFSYEAKKLKQSKQCFKLDCSSNFMIW